MLRARANQRRCERDGGASRRDAVDLECFMNPGKLLFEPFLARPMIDLHVFALGFLIGQSCLVQSPHDRAIRHYDLEFPLECLLESFRCLEIRLKAKVRRRL